MARYGRDFMGRVRGMWNQLSHGPQQERGWREERVREGDGRQPMQATGPGGEGYFLSPTMARDARYTMDYDRGGDDRGYPPSGMAQFGRAGAGRGYGGDFRTGRGGSDAGEFFVNRHDGGDTGYHAGYERDLGMRGGPTSGGRYGGDYPRGGFPQGYRYRGSESAGGYDRGYAGRSPTGYDRGFRSGPLDRDQRHGRDDRR